MRVDSSSTQQHEKEFEEYVGYKEWLKDNNPMLSALANSRKSTIFKNLTFSPINSSNYQPL
jgi:hypothetical protein